MKKIVSATLLLLITILAGMVIFLLVLSKRHHYSVHQELVQLINERFDEEVTFSDFSFSLIKKFPKAYINIKEVSARDGSREVVKIGDLEMIMNIRGLLKKKITVSRLLINDASLNPFVDSLGNKTHLFGGNKNTSSSNEKPLTVSVNRIVIRSSEINSLNKFKKNGIYLQIDKANLKLIADQTGINVTGVLEGKLDSLVTVKSALLSDLPLTVDDIVFNINKETNERSLENGVITAHTLKLIPRLRMKPQGTGNNIELSISSEGNLNTFIDLLELRKGFDITQVNEEADLRMFYNQRGYVDAVTRPYSEFDFEISNAELTGKILPYPLKIRYLDGNYNNGEDHSPLTAVVEIDTLHGEIQESYINGHLKLTNFSDPEIDAILNTHINISNLLAENNRMSISGISDINLVLKGKISELEKMHYSGYLGKMEMQNIKVNLKEKGLVLELKKGSAVIDNHILSIPDITGVINGSEFQLSGQMQNPLLHLVNGDEDLSGKLDLRFREFDITAMNSQPRSDRKKNKITTDILKHVSLQVSVKGEKINTSSGTIEDFHMLCRQTRNKVIIETAGFRFMDGEVSGLAEILLGKSSISSVNASLRGKFKDLNPLIAGNMGKFPAPEKRSLKLPDDVNLNAYLEVEKGDIAGIPLKNLVLDVGMINKEISVNRVTFEAFNGHTAASGRIKIDSSGVAGIWVNAGMNFRHLEADKLLELANNNRKQDSSRRKQVLPDKLELKIDLNADEATYRDVIVSDFRATVFLNEKQLRIDRFQSGLQFGKMDMMVVVDNYNNQNINYFIKANLNIDTISIEKFLAMDVFKQPGNNTGPPSATNKNLSDQIPFSENFSYDISVTANKLTYKAAMVNDMTLLVKKNRNKTELHKLAFSTDSGTVNIDGFFTTNRQGSAPGFLQARIEEMDISRAMSSLHNLNQDIVTSEQIKGTLSCKANMYFELQPDLKLSPGKNICMLDIDIHNAELNQVKPVQNMLFFVGHKAKDKMIIKDLKASAFFYNDNFYFSNLIMNDNIANLKISGQYALPESKIDLGAYISLSDLLFSSKEKRIVETQEGKFTLDDDMQLYLRMQGMLPDHKLSLSSKKKMKNFENDLTQQISWARKEFLVKEKKRLNKKEI